MSTRNKPPRRARPGKARILLLALISVVVLLVLLVALAPTLVSLGLGQGLVRGAMQDRVNGTVRFSGLSLSWLGAQSIRELEIVEPDGRTAVSVDVEASRGLLHLMRGALAPLELRVSGTLEGTIEADGSVSFGRLLRDDGAGRPAGAGKPGAGSPEPASLIDQGPIDIVLTGTTLRLEDVRGGRTVTFKDVDGRMTYAPGAATKLSLTAATESEGLDGAIELTGEALGLVDHAGRIQPRGAGLQVNAVVRSLPVPYTDVDGVIESLHVNVTSDDLTGQVLVLLDGEARVESEEPSSLEGRVVIERPLTAEGELDIAVERVSGTLSGSRVPTGLLAPALAAAGLVPTLDPTRDIGPTADIEAVITGGADGALSLALRSEHLESRLTGTLDAESGAVRLERSRARAAVQPGLLAALAGLEADRPVAVALDVERLALPGAAPDAPRPLGDAAVGAVLRIDGPVALAAIDGPDLGTLEQIEMRFDADRLADGLRLSGTGRVAGGELVVEEVLGSLIDADGRLAPRAVRPVGRLALTALPPGIVDAALDQDLLVAGMAATGLDLTVTTREQGSDLRADLEATVRAPAGETRLVVAARETAEGLSVESARLDGTIGPGLLARFQDVDAEPIDLTRAATVAVAVEPFRVPGNRQDGYRRPETMRATVRGDEIVLGGVPAMAEPLGVSGLEATVSMLPGAAARWGVAARAGLAGAQPLGDVDADLAVPGAGAAPFTGRVRVTEAAFGAWERQLGQERNSLRRWLGGRGALEVELSERDAGYAATLRPQTPTLGGTFVASVEGESLGLRAEDASFTVRRKVLVDMLSGKPVSEGEDGAQDAAEDGQRVRVPTPLRLNLAIEECRLPMALLRGEPFAPHDARIDARLTGGPLEIIYTDRTTAALRNIDLALKSADLAEGVELKLSADSAAAARRNAEQEQTGKVSVDGRLKNVLDESGAVRLAGSTLELDATLEQVPTAVVDAMGGFGGLLVDAVGPQLEARIVATDFSRSSGTLDADITATHGSLRAGVAGSDGTLRSIEGSPVRATIDLTPGLIRQLDQATGEGMRETLGFVLPVVPDVESAEAPIVVSGTDVVVPLDGDVSKLNADITVTVGAVQFRRESGMLGLLTAFDDSSKQTVPGSIDPVHATIRDGVIEYSLFALHVNAYAMRYTGKVDLNTRQVDLRTSVPLDGLAHTFHELEGYADKIIVPLVTRGPLGSTTTEIDPEFNLAEAIAEIGITIGLEELIRKNSGGDEDDPIGGLLRGLLGGDRKKDG